MIEKCILSHLRRKFLEKGKGLTHDLTHEHEQLQTIARKFKSIDYLNIKNIEF